MAVRGRPMTVWVDDDVVFRLDRLAKAVGMKRSSVAAALLAVASEEMELLPGLDSLRISLLMRDLRKPLHERLRDPDSVQEACGDDVSS